MKPTLFLNKYFYMLLAGIVLTLQFFPGYAGKETDRFSGQKQRLFFGLAVHGLPESADEIEKMAAETGLPVSMVNFFLQWPKDPLYNNFPEYGFGAIHQAGAMACLTWEPMYHEDGQARMIPATEIVDGKYDGYIDRFARQIRTLGYPVIIRFAHEMNIYQYAWGGERSEYGPNSPRRYREMFRYVVLRFKNLDVKNAFFAFCPNAESLPCPKTDPQAEWNQASNYYPGSSYVDVMGMDGYNWGQTRTIDEHGWQSKWRTFEDIFSSMYRQLKQIDPEKPVFVFETAAARQEGKDRSQWVRDAFFTAARWNIQGVFWFQADKETDWRLTADPSCSYCAPVRRNFFSPIPLFEGKNGS